MNWPAFSKGILLGALIPIAAYLPTGWPGFLWQIPLLVVAATVLVLLDKWDFHTRATIADAASLMDAGWEPLPTMTDDEEREFFNGTKEP